MCIHSLFCFCVSFGVFVVVVSGYWLLVGGLLGFCVL